MSIRNLDYLFAPTSVAVIGASERAHSVGATVLQNLTQGGFSGPVFAVNPKYQRLGALPVYARVADLPQVPDLAIICTPPATVPGLLAELGACGTRAVIVVTAGLDSLKTEDGRTLKQAMLDAARPHLLRILGPNCVGMLVPGIGLNASFAHTGAASGKLAFISQSGAMVTGVLDWAAERNIGFSKFISLGESADIDFGDLLDYLANDPDTSAILLYVEAITDARKFMSAARAAARTKPVLVIKAGRFAEGAKAAASHTGALAGADAVYDAAIRRAGMLRVFTTEELFDAVETLAYAAPLQGERLAILTNGGGPGVMATDVLIEEHGTLAALSADTLKQLDAVLPSTWSGANPVDIIGDAPATRYVQALEVLMQSRDADATLFIHAPTAIVPSTDIARTVVNALGRNRQALLGCWLGGAAVAEARRIFSQAGIPTYDTPEKAVRAFMQLVNYRRNQALLGEVSRAAPDTLPARTAREQARQVIEGALQAGRDMLNEPEGKAVLAAYGIPVVETRTVYSVEAALVAANAIGYPVVVKILSHQINHKSDVGGVALDLENSTALETAATGMLQRVARLRPDATVDGFTVQTMVRRPHSRELIIGVSTDPVFGPVILFGQGGIAVEVTADHALALPPLNRPLALDLIGQTRIARLLDAYRNLEAADLEAVCQTLMQVSLMITELPEILELDINPLLADADGVIALDARFQIAAVPAAQQQDRSARLAIRPYPEELVEQVDWRSKLLTLRPIKPEDAAQHAAFVATFNTLEAPSAAISRLRAPHSLQLARLTQIDYDREMAFIATHANRRGEDETLGVARALTDPDNLEAHFTLAACPDLHGMGLERLLLEKLVRYCDQRATARMVGAVAVDNKELLHAAVQLGFDTHAQAGPEEVGLVRMRPAEV